MIYVYRSAGYDKEFNIIHLIKIGYTEDITKRNSTYTSHNPGIRLICTVPDLGEDVEHALHSIFGKFLYPDFGREWFVYNEEIIDFFKTHTTPESILDYPEVKKELEFLNESRITTRNRHKLLAAIDLLVRVYSEDNSDTLEFQKALSSCLPIRKYNSLKITDPYDYLRTQCDLVTDSLIESAKNYIHPEITDEAAELFLKEFNSMTIFRDKMKLLCDSLESGRLSESLKVLVLDLIPMEYKNYILTLGINRIRANSYTRNMLEKEFESSMSRQNINWDLAEKIKSTFIVGEKYTKAEIKEKLREIYKSFEYFVTPKATDLEQWFDVKETKITNSVTKKRDMAYEIISKKF